MFGTTWKKLIKSYLTINLIFMKKCGRWYWNCAFITQVNYRRGDRELVFLAKNMVKNDIVDRKCDSNECILLEFTQFKADKVVDIFQLNPDCEI